MASCYMLGELQIESDSETLFIVADSIDANWIYCLNVASGISYHIHIHTEAHSVLRLSFFGLGTWNGISHRPWNFCWDRRLFVEWPSLCFTTQLTVMLHCSVEMRPQFSDFVIDTPNRVSSSGSLLLTVTLMSDLYSLLMHQGLIHFVTGIMSQITVGQWYN